jgi:hypothetical protein
MYIENKNDFMDLGAPIYMSDQQFEKFKDFMKNLFGDDIQYINIIEPEREFDERETVSQMRFSPDEMFIMLQPGSFNQKIRRLQELYPQRKRWTIEVKIGDTFPKFNKFLKDRGLTFVTREVVEEFLREMGWL